MKITIQGLDYSASLDGVRPLTIERKLNEPGVCEFCLSLPSRGELAVPVRNQPVAVTGDDGTQFFTGYVACAPVPEYAGLAMEGPRFRLAIRAVSDEILMDQLPATPIKVASGMTAGQLIHSLITHTRSAALAWPATSLEIPVSGFAAAPGAPWSVNASHIASQARAAYRVLGGALQLAEIPVTLHPLDEANGTLNLAALAFNASVKRALANDVTVCGEHEPAAYVTEYFQGDGTTTQFNLAALPFFPPASTTAIIAELFNQPDIDRTAWDTSGAAACLSLGAGGLAINGGSGVDGETMLTWIDSIELGGTLLVEASGVMLSANSSGVLAGLYAGADSVSGCVAGFQAQTQPGTGAVSLQPMVLGQAAGATYAINPANQYTLRIRLHCPEWERSLAIYRSFGDGGAIARGGQADNAPAKLLFEIEECVDGVAGMPVTLYDGAINALPQACSVVAASLITMMGSMRAFRLTNLGTGWVVSTPANGNPNTRRLGSQAAAGECQLDRSGRLVFYTGFVPSPGERIAVSYRALARAVGRAVNADSSQGLASLGLPAVSQWIGTVTNPPARSSADCRNAATVMVAASAGHTALLSGSYKCIGANLDSDVWPGDALILNAPSLSLDSQVVVRTVKLTYASTYPDVVAYNIEFANDWADDLAIRTSDAVPADAWLPSAVSPSFPPNLSNVMVTTISGPAINISTGTAPPAGGGFEIRRRDFAFMPGYDSDLVMRGSQQGMTFSRQTAGDRFYIRMYDNATPPNYSEFSAALFFNLPVNSGQ